MIRIFLITIFVVFIAANVLAGPGYEIGDTVKDFKLKNVDGKMVSLSDFKAAKGYIVVFDCNTCPYSKGYNKRIIALNEKYAPEGFILVAINSNDPTVSPGDSFEKMQAYAKEKQYSFPYLFDKTQEVAKAYGATNTPHVFVLNKEKDANKVAYIGSIDDSPRSASNAKKHYVEDAVDALLGGKKVPVTNTKAIGCTIKWKRS